MDILISEKDMVTARRGAKRNRWIFCCLAVLCLAVFVAFCLRVRTINARSMTVWMMVVMTLLGWLCMGFYMLVLRPSRAKAHHLETLLSGTAESFEGICHLAAVPDKIPGSVWVRRVTLEGERNPDSLDPPERKRLNLDEHLAGRMPPEGSRVRVTAVHGYILGVEMLAAPDEKTSPPHRMKRSPRIRWIFRRISWGLPLYILWAMMVVIIGGFVFSRILDAKPKNKLVIYADCDVRMGAELGDMLEKELTDPVRLVQVRSFDYAMFQESGIGSADLYIVPVSRADDYREVFAPLPEGFMEEEERLTMEGVPYGIPFWVPEAGSRCAAAYFHYAPEETYYLFFGQSSLHLSGNDGAVDNQAVDAAIYLMELR